MAGIIAAIANIMSISFSNDGETFLTGNLTLVYHIQLLVHFYENVLNIGDISGQPN